MRILLDQNLPRALRTLLPGHEVTAAAEMGWAEVANGEIIAAADAAGFGAMITGDQNIRYQQNLSGRRIALVVLSTNRWPSLQISAAHIAEALENGDRRQLSGGCARAPNVATETAAKPANIGAPRLS